MRKLPQAKLFPNEFTESISSLKSTSAQDDGCFVNYGHLQTPVTTLQYTKLLDN